LIINNCKAMNRIDVIVNVVINGLKVDKASIKIPKLSNEPLLGGENL